MAYLGISYNYADWQETFRVIEKAEEDTVAVITSIRKLSANAINSAHPYNLPLHLFLIHCGQLYLNLKSSKT